MAFIVIKIDGDTYVGKDTPVTADEHARMMASLCELASDVTHMNVELQDGRNLILPREAARRAVWLICHTAGKNDVP